MILRKTPVHSSVSDDCRLERAEKAHEKKITVLTLCAMLVALCASAEAQQPAKVPRLGFIEFRSRLTMILRAHALEKI